jgi:hypothetical protein
LAFCAGKAKEPEDAVFTESMLSAPREDEIELEAPDPSAAATAAALAGFFAWIVAFIRLVAAVVRFEGLNVDVVIAGTTVLCIPSIALCFWLKARYRVLSSKMGARPRLFLIPGGESTHGARPA